MRDSPNGKRYGKRDPKGRIVEAYGFDLSPIAARYTEFVRLVEEARAERLAIPPGRTSSMRPTGSGTTLVSRNPCSTLKLCGSVPR
jgi:hypothetical protein